MVSQLDEVVKILTDTAEENDAKACYQLDSFINSIKMNILTGVSTTSDFDHILKSTFSLWIIWAVHPRWQMRDNHRASMLIRPV